jgi:hypothetical protein
MAKIVPIDKMAEILFDNSEEIPNDIYIHIMNLTIRYYDYGDNEEELVQAISLLDTKIQSKLITKPFFRCTCYCNCIIGFIYLIHRYFFIFVCIIIFIGVLFGVIFSLTFKNGDKYFISSPPPKS